MTTKYVYKESLEDWILSNVGISMIIKCSFECPSANCHPQCTPRSSYPKTTSKRDLAYGLYFSLKTRNLGDGMTQVILIKYNNEWNSDYESDEEYAVSMKHYHDGRQPTCGLRSSGLVSVRNAVIYAGNSAFNNICSNKTHGSIMFDIVAERKFNNFTRSNSRHRNTCDCIECNGCGLSVPYDTKCPVCYLYRGIVWTLISKIPEDLIKQVIAYYA